MTKNTYELAVGDVITTYGVSLRLTERREYKDCVAFSTEYVSGETEEMGGYGRMMRNGKWIVQGNQYATWSVGGEA
jgi:hypothetical protein